MRINKTLGIGLVAVLLLSMVIVTVPVGAMPAQAIWVEPTITDNLDVGDNFTVDVMINITDPPGAATGMFGFEYKLFWNTSIQLTGCTTHIPAGWGPPNGFLVKNETGVWSGPSLPEKIGLGYHYYSYTCLTGPVFTGVMSLCTYTFKYNVKGTYVLDLYEVKIVDDTATLISPLGVYDGYVTPPVHNINTGLSYLTIQDAINAPETLNGHTILADAGTYYEHVVVNKTLSIIGEDKYNTVIDGNSTGNVINITANDVRIAEFTIQNSGLGYPDSGVFVYDSNGNNISQNIISANVFGIYLNSSDDNTIEGNKVSLNSDSGIVLETSDDNTLVNNNVFSNTQYGFMLNYSDSNIIVSNNVSDNFRGIQLWNSHNNTLVDNTLSNNNDEGIRLLDSNNNSIVENDVLGNWKGIKLQTSLHNTLNGNDVSNNDYGIRLIASSSNNTIVGNTVSNNDYGIFLDVSDNNTIFHNNFIGNTQQVDSTNSINIWDDGYPSGGNYWSDHNPPDIYSGPYQNETGSDGIGDLPYIIDGNNTDRYPLIYPYGYVPSPDVNGDGIVDIVDIVIVALAFGTKPGDPDWNPIADLNQDGEVDIVDIVMVALHFGETYP